MHVHLLSPPADAARSTLIDHLPSGATWSEGDTPSSRTTVVVAGLIDEEKLASLEALDTFIVPFAGLPKKTRSMLLGRPDLAVYNIHHNAPATAEMAMSLLLAASKRIVPADRLLRAGDWRHRFEQTNAIELAGRHAVVLGHGAVGRRVARAAAGLGMRVTAVSRSGIGALDDGTPLRSVEDLPALLPRADALIICLPATDETEGLIDAAAIALLPDDAVLVNVARGSIVDEEALHGALEGKRLFGAGIDVWYRYGREDGGEPTPPSAFDFGALDNVVMSPHRAGHVVDTEVRRMAALAELLSRLAIGRPPRQVDVSVGY